MPNVNLDTVLYCLRRMAETVLGLKQVRGLLPDSSGREMLAALIVEAEQNIAEIKRKVIQETRSALPRRCDGPSFLRR